MKKILLAGIAAAFCAAPAIAADMPVKAPYAAPAFNWTGFYVGAHAGYGWGRVTGTTITNDLPQAGWFGGGQLGYNYQLATNWVAGVEADAAATDIDLRNAPLFAGFHNHLEDFGTVRGRLGYAWDRLLVYGTGGWAWGHEHRVVPGLPDSSNDHHGYSVGVGIEWAATQNITYKIEYLHVKLDEAFYFPTAPSTTGWRGDTIKVGVNWLFQTGGKAPVVAKY
jgi:outer membrane immunogenic protein